MSQADWELGFWRGELSKGKDAFIEQRRQDWEVHLSKFPELSKKGKILEVGSGLVSVFEFSDKDCVSIDPLCREYQAMSPLDNPKVDYREDWEGIKDGSYGEVLCVNVIDHTSDPKALLERIKRCLKPRGKLYFEVNFDLALSPAHYGLWDRQKVDAFFVDWELVRCSEEPMPAYNQTRYYAVYKKI